jgi:hypothetical protein
MRKKNNHKWRRERYFVSNLPEHLHSTAQGSIATRSRKEETGGSELKKKERRPVIGS